MFTAFFESIKYVGHLLPLAFLRVFVGYVYLNQGLIKYNGDFLTHPRLADLVSNALSQSTVPAWSYGFFENIAIPHWGAVSGIIVALEVLVGLSYLLGYVVRPMAVMGVFLCLVYLPLFPIQEPYYKTLIAIHITFAVLSAGRCLGFDYYFYKRNRGIWW